MPLRFARISMALSVSAILCFACSAQSATNLKKMKPLQQLSEGIAHNGVGDSPSKPWHLHAYFRTFDLAGKATNSTFEEWWFGPKSYKMVWTGALNQVDVVTDEGLFRSGDAQWPDATESLLSEVIETPFSLYPFKPQTQDLTAEPAEIGGTKLRCLYLLNKHTGTLTSDGEYENAVAYCFDRDSLDLRYITSSGKRQRIFLEDLTLLGPRIVAENIHVTRNGKDLLLAKIDKLEELPTDAPRPSPSAQSVRFVGRVKLPDGRTLRAVSIDMSGMRDATSAALFSKDHAEASVRLVVGKDGQVLQATPVSGPPELAAAYAKVCLGFRYEPFRIASEPAEAEMVEHFSAGRSAAFITGFSVPSNGRR